jgi:hypothetical protein
MDGLEIAGVAAVPLIVGVVEVMKRLGLPERWAPVAALGCGVGLMVAGMLVADVPKALQLYERVVVGLGLGLMAAGLYSGGRTVLERGRDEP